MSFIEVKRRDNIEYASFVKKFSLMGKSFRVRKHIGKNVPTLNKREHLKNNFDEITIEEFNITKRLFTKLDIMPVFKCLARGRQPVNGVIDMFI